VIWFGLATLVVGILLSAFFSGSETGFYRATRVRLVLDAMGGDTIARGLLWLTNHPSLFVATTLIGNNIANYITSLSMVILAGTLFTSESYAVEILAPILFSPLVFVYGESLPKSLFYYAPNKLLRLGGPFFLLCTVLFAPISAVLYLLSRILQWLVGEAPENVRLVLARKELQQVIEAGQQIGILEPSQRALAQSFFAVAGQPVSTFYTPIARVVSVRVGTKKSDATRLARRHRVAAVPVTEPGDRKLAGYVQTVDFYLDDSELVESYRPLMQIEQSETHSGALVRMQSEKETLASVVNDEGHIVGLLYFNRLAEPLFRDP